MQIHAKTPGVCILIPYCTKTVPTPMFKSRSKVACTVPVSASNNSSLLLPSSSHNFTRTTILNLFSLRLNSQFLSSDKQVLSLFFPYERTRAVYKTICHNNNLLRCISTSTAVEDVSRCLKSVSSCVLYYRLICAHICSTCAEVSSSSIKNHDSYTTRYFIE